MSDAPLGHSDSLNPRGSYIGQRRDMNGRGQVCIGPCRRCGTPVWRYADDPVKDELPIHKRLCRDMEAAGA